MNNYKLYTSLSSETKKYIDKVFSFIEYLSQHDDIISIVQRDENGIPKSILLEEGNSIISLAFFLALFDSEDLELQEIESLFKSKGITLEDCSKYFNNASFKDIQIKPASETEVFQTLNLSDITDIALSQLQYNFYLEEIELTSQDLTPIQLFDFMINQYYEPLTELMREQFEIESFYDDELYFEYEEKTNDMYKKFAKEHGIDVDEMIEEDMKNAKEFKFNNCIIVSDMDGFTMVLESGIEEIQEDITYQHSNDELPPICELVEINNQKVTNELLERLSEEQLDDIVVKVIDPNLEKEIVFTIKKDLLFGSITQIKQETVSFKKKFPNLTKHGENLTELHYKRDPAVGREAELRRVMQILAYPEKDKSLVIVGDAGIGKTALVKGLAYRIQQGNVPRVIKDLKIISIDISTLMAGTKYAGTLEEKMKAILDEAGKDNNIVLFMDELHRAIGAGKTEGDDNSIAEILKPYLDYGKTRVIGATTSDEYIDLVEQNQAFKTRLKKVEIKEPQDHVIYDIVYDLMQTYDSISFSRLDCSEEERRMIIEWLINTTSSKKRNYFDKASNPRLIVDIVKEAYAIAALNDCEIVTKENFCEAVLNEDRLGKSARTDAVAALRRMIPTKRECKILEFKPRNS